MTSEQKPSEEAPSLERKCLMIDARAVLQAIREPSEDMACAAVDSYWMAIKGSADDANIIQTHDMGNMYTAMIDAAMGEK